MDLFVVVVKRNRHRIFIFLRYASAEAHFIRRTEPTIPVFPLPLCLTFNGQAGKWNGFKTGDGNLQFRNFTQAIRP